MASTSRAAGRSVLVESSPTWVIDDEPRRVFDRHALWPHVEALQRDGYTVVPGVVDPDTVAALRQLILDRARPGPGARLEVDVWSLFEAGPLVPRLLLEAVPLAFADLVCGKGVLGSMKGIVRDAQSDALGLHAENAAWLPSPYGPHNFVCSVMLACDEFDEPGGGTGFVPGSHLTMADPTLEAVDALGGVVTPRASPGSLIIWLGGTWHATNRRTRPGPRVSLLTIFTRPSLRPGQDVREIPESVLGASEELRARVGFDGAFERGRDARPRDHREELRRVRGLPRDSSTIILGWGEHIDASSPPGQGSAAASPRSVSRPTSEG